MTTFVGDDQWIKVIKDYLATSDAWNKNWARKTAIVSIGVIPPEYYAIRPCMVTKEEADAAFIKFDHILEQLVKESEEYKELVVARIENWSGFFHSVKIYYLYT